MRHNDGLVSANDDYCLADPGRTYLVYLPAGGRTEIDLGSSQEQFTVEWFNPREGGELQPAAPIRGPGWAEIASPPADETKDWVLLVREAADQDLPEAGRVTGFALMDCRTNRPVPAFDPIRPGAILNLSQLPTKLSLRANTEPAQVGSVQFQINGHDVGTADSTAPFAFPRDVNGQYEPWKVAAGKYTLAATPLAQGAGDGQAGAEYTVTFEVIRGKPD